MDISTITEFFSWDMACTYAGAVMITTILTQFIKQIKWLEKIPTQLISYVIALAVMLCGQAFAMGGITLESGLLCALNAVIVAMASNGAYNNLTDLDIKG